MFYCFIFNKNPMKKVLLVLVALFLVGGGLQAERKKVGLVLSLSLIHI